MPNTLTTTQQTGPAPWAAPYYQSLWNGAMNVANRPFQQYQGPQVAGLSDIQTGALGGINGAMYGNPTTWAGMNQLGNIIGNQGNPNEGQVADTITADANRAFGQNLGQLNEIFSNPNSFGSDRHALGAGQLSQDFGRGLGQSLGNLEFGQYNTGLDRSMSAAGQAQSMTNSSMNNMMGGLQAGAVPQQNQQQMYNQGQQNFNNWWNYPQQQSQFLGGIMGMGNPGQVSSSTQPGPNQASQAIGGGLLALQGLNGLYSGYNNYNSGSGYLNGFTGLGSDGSYIYG